MKDGEIIDATILDDDGNIVYDPNLGSEQKKQKALQIVKKYSLGALAVGATPIPFSDVALLAPTQIAMLTHINTIYGIKMSKSELSKICLGLLGVMAASFVGRSFVSNIFKFIPGIGSIAGGAISGVTAQIITNTLGNAYIAAIEEDPKAFEMPSVVTEEFTNDIIELIKKYIKNYKDFKKSL